MRAECILHVPMSEYACGLDEHNIVYRIRCAKGDLKRVTLCYADTACRVTPLLFSEAPMEIAASDEFFDYWQVIVESPYDRVYYYFALDDGQQELLYYGYVFTDHLVDDRSQYFKLPINHRADIAGVPDWVCDAVVYNIFPDSFATSRRFLSEKPVQLTYQGQPVRGRLGGTLDGVAENVDYIKELGVNCVYLNPVFAAGEYHKYDLLDYFHVDPCFGGDRAFRRMVETLHRNGIRVIIDGVFNHCGWNFFAFDDVVRNQEKSPYCSWFYRLTFPVTRPESPESYPGYACFAYERMMPKLDTSNPEVRDYFCRVAGYWIREYGIDGWRLDVASEADDGFWRAFRRAAKEADPQTLLIGEVWESAAHWLNGDMFDSTMNYDLRKHSELFFARGEIDAAAFSGRVTQMLMRYRLQMLPAQLNLLDSHDVSRFLSLCGGDTRRYRAAVLFMMCFVGMPSIFYGDELGLTGVDEEQYRSPMPWDGGNKELLAFFRRAVRMRRELISLRRGDFHMVRAEAGSGLLIFARSCKEERATVCINAFDRPEALRADTEEKNVSGDRMPPLPETLCWSEGLADGILQGFGFAVYVDKRG